MNEDIINYYSDKINIDYANNIKNICRKDKEFNKFIKLCFRHDISFIEKTKNNKYSSIPISDLLEECKNRKKKMILELGKFIIDSELVEEDILLKNITENLKKLKKNIYDINRIIGILNSYEDNDILNEYCDFNLNNYDIFIKEKNFKYTEKDNIISIDSNILNDNLINEDKITELKNIKRYYIGKKNPFIAEYSNENI